MNLQHPPDGPQNASEATTAPDPIGDQGPVPGGAQRSTEGVAAISLRDQIAAALMPPSGAFVMAGIEAQADAVMAVVQPELDQLIEIQVIDLQVAASIAQHEQQRAEQAEAERDRLKAAIDQARRTCDDIEAEAHHLFGDGNRPSNELGRANGLLQAANRIRTALDQQDSP